MLLKLIVAHVIKTDWHVAYQTQEIQVMDSCRWIYPSYLLQTMCRQDGMSHQVRELKWLEHTVLKYIFYVLLRKRVGRFVILFIF